MSYSTQHLAHFDICDTFEVLASGDDLRERRQSEHAGFELTFSAPGCNVYSDMEVRGQVCTIAPGTVLLYNGLEVHTESYFDEPDSTCRMDAIVFAPQFMMKLLKDEDVDPLEIVFDSLQMKLKPATLQLVRTLMQFRRTPQVSEFSYDCLITELLSDLLMDNPHSHSGKLGARVSSGHFPGNILKAKKLIAERYRDSSLTVEEVARCSGLSKFHFIREFKRQAGLSPRQYLNTLRVDSAKAALTTGRRSITDSALDSGFANLSTFNKAFKRQTGHAPSALKAN